MFNKGGARCLEGVFFFPQVLDPPYVVGGFGGGGGGIISYSVNKFEQFK